MKQELRVEVVATAQAMSRAGLSRGTSGNVSARVRGGLLITPSGVAYDALRPSDVVEVGERGEVLSGGLAPSTEWRLHAAIYAARPEVGAVVHAHSSFATTLSCLRRSIPAVHYMVAAAGGNDVRCAPYATFGTAELAAGALAALVERRACLLSNHGQVAVHANLAGALRLAGDVEELAAIYWRALQIGAPHILDDAEMARVHERYRGYGQPQPRR
jgi:L-fuculose-phosphate aldolase